MIIVCNECIDEIFDLLEKVIFIFSDIPIFEWFPSFNNIDFTIFLLRTPSCIHCPSIVFRMLINFMHVASPMQIYINMFLVNVIIAGFLSYNFLRFHQ